MNQITAPIHIIYASTGGNTEHVMEQVAQYWQKAGVEVSLHRSEQTSVELIKNNTYFLLATSTWDQGTLNPFFKNLFEEMEQTDFTGKVASFIGLGDRRYEKHYFCSGMLTLKEVWEKNKGKAIGVPLMIGREPFEDIVENMVKEWADNTLPLYLGDQLEQSKSLDQQIPTKEPQS